MIRITGLRHRLLDIPDFSIGSGYTAVIGRNGSGKTTLLELCAGMETPESGAITISGREPQKVPVGWVGEFPDRTMLFSRVTDEIASSLMFSGSPGPDAGMRVARVAEALGITHLLPSCTRDLSGGEKALVAFAAAIIRSPELLVLDEVDSHLDEETFCRVDRAVRRSGASHVLFCTQNMDTAAGADSVLVMEEGSVRLFGPPDEVFAGLAGTCSYPPLWRLCR
jgi:energy-coupling factor transport system ATP-binding protein